MFFHGLNFGTTSHAVLFKSIIHHAAASFDWREGSFGEIFIPLFHFLNMPEGGGGGRRGGVFAKVFITDVFIQLMM